MTREDLMRVSNAGATAEGAIWKMEIARLQRDLLQQSTEAARIGDLLTMHTCLSEVELLHTLAVRVSEVRKGKG